ncbi:MAG: hypothetical protein Q4C87_08290 [Actinomycetaceae bacterium]|nr:hypothetical protein [Actinomycetaceae bacterium]
MQTTMIRIDFPVDLVEQVRRAHPQCPSSIEVMHHEDFGEFAPLGEPFWYPDEECLAFAHGTHERYVALNLNDLSVWEIDTRFGIHLKANSGLKKYSRCVSHFFAGVPYDDDFNAEEPILSDRAIELAREIDQIDPGYGDSNTFWGEFVWDVTLDMWSSSQI